MLDPVTWRLEDGRIIRSCPSITTELRGKLRIIDQTLLPEELHYRETDDLEEVYDWIKKLAVRGAPAIGCAAALGLAAAAKNTASGRQDFLDEVKKQAGYLASSRPTAVNLSWALNRCVKTVTDSPETTVTGLKTILIREALAILDEDIAMCMAIGRNGLPLFKPGMGVLTHCNAGALATGDYGTALAAIYTAHENGLKIKVFADETRPLLQGSRLTAWELGKAGVDVTVICDNMAAQVMKEGRVQLIIVGADRIAANGDTANKIGTYSLAVLARYHKIPFYVAAPSSTFDLAMADGCGIPIEQRSPEEVRNGFGRKTAPDSVNIYNPAFDVTPHELITGIITEKCLLLPPYQSKISALLKSQA